MTPRTQVIEAMARAMNSIAYAKHEAETGPDMWPHFVPAATALDALLSTLPTLGLAVVPVEATEEMTDAGWIDKEDVDPREIWQAMGAAAPNPLAGGE